MVRAARTVSAATGGTCWRTAGSGSLARRTARTGWGLHALTTPFGAPSRVGYSWAVQPPNVLPHDPCGHPGNVGGFSLGIGGEQALPAAPSAVRFPP